MHFWVGVVPDGISFQRWSVHFVQDPASQDREVDDKAVGQRCSRAATCVEILHFCCYICIGLGAMTKISKPLSWLRWQVWSFPPMAFEQPRLIIRYSCFQRGASFLSTTSSSPISTKGQRGRLAAYHHQDKRILEEASDPPYDLMSHQQ